MRIVPARGSQVRECLGKARRIMGRSCKKSLGKDETSTYTTVINFIHTCWVHL